MGYALMEIAQNSHSAGATEIVITVSESDSQQNLEIEDNGSGLTEVSPEKIEELWSLGHSDWKRSGLGLTIVKACIMQHRGKASLSQGSKGASLLIELPRSAPHVN